MSYGYGRSNPYDERGDAQPGYGAPSPRYGGYSNGPAMGRDDYEGTNVEMEPLTGTGNSFPHREDPNAILNECRKIDDEIKEMKSVVFRRIQSLQSNILNSTGDNSLQRELDEANAELMSMYRNLTGRVKRIKQKPESGSPRNAPQVGKIDRDLKDTHKQYLSIEAEFSRKMREQSARQYRIVRPDATEAEVQQAVDNPQQQMFSQALMQSNRQGQAQSTLNAVTARHQEIEKIAQQMKELAQLFEDMDNLVVQQEAAVTNIEMKGEEVVDNMDKGTEQIGVAIKSARNARKWKWWCLGICVLIVIIIVVVVLIYKFVIQTPVKVTTGTAKRFVLSESVPALKLTSGHAVVPGEGFKPSSKLVVPGLEYVPGSRKFRRFQG